MPEVERRVARDTELTVLPRHQFVGPVQSLELTAMTADHLDRYRAALPPELEKSPERIAQIADLKSAIEAFGESLGLDLSERGIGSDDVHLYAPEEFDKIRQRFGRSKENHAAHLSTGEVVVDDDPAQSSAETLAIVSHELLHGYSHAPTKIGFESGMIDLQTPRRGYATMGARNTFNVLDEVVVEKMNQQIQQHYWDEYPSLAGQGLRNKAYTTAVPVVEALVQRVADASDKSPDQIWQELFKGELTGDMQPLRRIYSVIGTEGMKVLAAYNESSPEHAKRTAENLGLVALGDESND